MKLRRKEHKRNLLEMTHVNPRTAKSFSLTNQPKKGGGVNGASVIPQIVAHKRSIFGT